MAFLSVRVDGADLARLRALGASLPTTLERAVRRVLVLVTNEIKKKFGEWGYPHTRSGSLARSWTSDLTRTSAGAVGTIASSSVYAAIQNYGGTVTPTSSEYLAIPLEAAKTAAGVARFASPRDVPGLFAAKSRAGNLLLFAKRGKEIIPMFALKRSVTLEPTGYVEDALEAAEPQARDVVSTAIGEEIARLSLG